jgi:hypothetical protein
MGQLVFFYLGLFLKQEFEKAVLSGVEQSQG